jgi:hypothetical protein
LLFGSSLRWDSVCIASAGHKPLNSQVARGVDQPFSRIGIDRIPIRPDVGAPMPAGLTGEPWLDIRKPRPSVGAYGHRMAATIVRTINEDTAHATGAQFTKGDLLLAGGLGHPP